MPLSAIQYGCNSVRENQMKVVTIVIAILFIVVLGFAGWLWGARGGLIDRSQAIDEKWAQVENVYQRRFDLIPNLVAAVDNFMERQRETLTEVIELRQRVIELQNSAQEALNQQNTALLDSLSAQLSQRLNSFINVVVERYPDFKGEQVFQDLMTQLEGTENRIAQERRLFNEAVRDYNTYRQRGVAALAAGSFFGFPYEREYFLATPGATTAPSVEEAFESN
jgi:LemA protein